MESEAIAKALAELVKPHLKPELHPVDWYKDPKNIGLSQEEQLSKLNEAIIVFERAVMESKWDVEKTTLMLEEVGKVVEQIKGLDLAQITDPEEHKRTLIKAEARLDSYRTDLAAQQDRLLQQQCYILALRSRMARCDKDQLSLTFKDTDEIRGK